MIKKNPKLSEMLEQFRIKTAEVADPEAAEAVPGDTAAVDPAAQEVVDSMNAPEGGPTAEDVANAAVAVEDAKAQVVDAKDALTEVAADFINDEKTAMQKEAKLFGELFAEACIEHMQKTAAAEELEKRAYGAPYNDIVDQLVLEKTAAVYDQAYSLAAANIAGFETVADMQKFASIDGDLSPKDAMKLAQLICKTAAVAADCCIDQSPQDHRIHDAGCAVENLREKQSGNIELPAAGDNPQPFQYVTLHAADMSRQSIAGVSSR